MSNTFDGVLAYEDYAWLDNDLSFDAPADLLGASSDNNSISALSVPVSGGQTGYNPSEEKVDAGASASSAVMAHGRGAVSAGKGAHLPEIGEFVPSVSDDNYGRDTLYTPSDTLFGNQWHLENTGQSGGTAGVDLNVLEVWDDYSGEGVTVGIWDDGVSYTHSDLDGNYDASMHIEIGGNTHDPYPVSADSAHGTAVAGVIAAENDGAGTVGVAFDATIAGVDILSEGTDIDTNAEFYGSMAEMDNFDITNHSWGFTTPFAANLLSADTFWTNFFAGVADAVDNGRGGLGTVVNVAAGNSREAGDSANSSNWISMPETIAVAAASHDGGVSYYSNPGSSVLIAGHSNSTAGSGIWTTDREGSDGYESGDYTGGFGGTSSATPLVSGLVALMLEANPDLGWRDVQNILAYSSNHTGADIGDSPEGFELFEWGWNGADNWNGGGLHFSNDYGFGLVDAHAAVRLAETWTDQQTSANWENLVADTWSGSQSIPDNNPTGFTFDFTATDDVDLEMVGLRVDIPGGYMGDYYITLTSPSGTTSIVAFDHVPGDSATDSFLFTSNAFRGEDSAGTWTVTISDRWSSLTGTLEFAQLEFYGGTPDNDDLYVFTEEFSDYAGVDGHSTVFGDSNGGTDTLNAAAVTSNTMINLGAGAGTIDGVAVTSSGGIENVFTGDGDDILFGDASDNWLRTGRGDDIIYGSAGADTLDGGEGEDWVLYTASSTGVTVNLASGTGSGGDADGDTLTDIEIVAGSDHDDSLFGNDQNNTLLGGAGNDVIRGFVGHDDLSGGGGNDNVKGGGGFDTIYGQGGNDRLFGEGGSDTLFGGSGADKMYGNGNNDVMYGDAGADLLAGGRGSDSLIGGTGNDVLSGGEDSDFVVGEAGEDMLFGGSGDDALLGGADDDVVRGDSGNDSLYGHGGGDKLEGGAGNDELTGGDGRDLLFGGTGSDTFVYTALSDSGTSGSQRDIIRDFESGVDQIDLSGIDADSGTGGDQAFTFITGAFSSTAGEMRVIDQGGRWLVQADTDGDGSADFAIRIFGEAPVEADFVL
ncbi:S8 family serine peptidase [Euryhalocaulis caribicus]|uniref:S8 family serine peptidase n=1 Tax=Euryhalocaulis caribicus TaxID=1161401 RepID=UPI0003A4E33B|nr:S8 family serine peptidase [Euryhalocaulis caribicus]